MHKTIEFLLFHLRKVNNLLMPVIYEQNMKYKKQKLDDKKL